MTALRYRHRHVVTLDETNLVGNVYFAHYLRWQGHCREHFLAEHAPGVLKALRHNEFTLATASCSMDFYAECFALDEIEIEMTLRATSGNRITMDFEYRRGPVLVAHGTQSVACLRHTESGAVPVEIPAELADALSPFR